MSDTFTSQ